MTRRSSTASGHYWVTPLAFLIVAGIGAAQLLLPIGWALAGLYTAPVALVALWSTFRHSFSVMVVALASTVIATFVFFSSPFWDSGLTALTDYVLPIALMWFITLLAVLRKWRERKTKRAHQGRLICTVCGRVSIEGVTWSLAEYGEGHRGTLLAIGTCGECAGKWDAPHADRMQM